MQKKEKYKAERTILKSLGVTSDNFPKNIADLAKIFQSYIERMKERLIILDKEQEGEFFVRVSPSLDKDSKTFNYLWQCISPHDKSMLKEDAEKIYKYHFNLMCFQIVFLTLMKDSSEDNMIKTTQQDIFSNLKQSDIDILLDVYPNLEHLFILFSEKISKDIKKIENSYAENKRSN
jgi:hypothetical protein